MIQFILFHLGVVAAISATFIIPYWPQLFEIDWIVCIFQTITGAAFIVGLIRLYRRIADPAIRKISSIDDYFSLTLMTIWISVAVIAIPNRYDISEWPLIIYFSLTAFFLVYVPFSKICHYFYYPFTKYFLGRTMGHRNVYPRKRGA